MQDTFYFTSLPDKRNLRIPVFLADVVCTGTGSSKKKHKFLMPVTLERKLK